MKARRGPSLRAQWLGKLLREARDAAGLRLVDAGEYIQRDQATMSRMESGIVPARVPEVLALLNLYGAADETFRDAMEQLSREVFRKGWWEGYAKDVSRSFVDYPWLESRAQEIRSFDAVVIMGLLQTREYAEAAIRATADDASEEQIDRWIQLRMERQRVLDKEEPPRLAVILDEGLVRRTVGGAVVMRDQLAHLVKLAGRPAVEIRVLPASAGAHAGLDGPFKILTIGDPFPDVAYAENLAGATYVESDGVDRFQRAYDGLRDAALSPAKSLALIKEAARDLR